MGVMRWSLTVLILVALGAGLLSADAARSQSVADQASAWGLLGTWAVDCGLPPSRSNAYLSYARKGQAVIHRRDFGDMQDEHAVIAARLLRDSSLEIVIDLASLSQVRTVVLRRVGERGMRAMTNRDAAGHYSVKDGKLADGRQSPVQLRCSEAGW
jgi:hypothetical protein